MQPQIATDTFICRDPQLAIFLHTAGIEHLVYGTDKATRKPFAVFNSSDTADELIGMYEEIQQANGINKEYHGLVH